MSIITPAEDGIYCEELRQQQESTWQKRISISMRSVSFYLISMVLYLFFFLEELKYTE
ncbi:hypothetical protein X975_25689, partial [Stegodyphus mimosarum]